jgi:hypothetical protein
MGVNPSKQHRSHDKEGVWKLEVKLENNTKHVSVLTVSHSWFENQDIKATSVCSSPRKWKPLSIMLNGSKREAKRCSHGYYAYTTYSIV